MTLGIYSCCLKFAVLSHHMHVVEHLTSAKIGLYADRDWADIVASNPAPSLMSKLLQAVPEADQPARVQDALVQASLHGNLDIIKQVSLVPCTEYRIVDSFKPTSPPCVATRPTVWAIGIAIWATYMHWLWRTGASMLRDIPRH